MTYDISKPHCYTCGHAIGTQHSPDCPRRRWYADGVVRGRDQSWETSEAPPPYPPPYALRPAIVGQRSLNEQRADLIATIEREGSWAERLWLPLLRVVQRRATR